MRSGKWMDVWRRVRAMSAAEFADRLGQQISARTDLLRYKLGSNFAPPLRIAAEGPAPVFFFSAQSLPSLGSRLRQLFPEQAASIVQQAEKICAHRFDLLGHEDLNYGAAIDWHYDHINQVRSTRKPWFKIRYLDFIEVGDSKIVWELNRHQHLVMLAKAYRLTGNEVFATELFHQWQDWHRENPYPIGVNWASSLEVSFRSLSWIWVYFLLADSATLPTGFREQWLLALGVSGRHIERYLSTYFSPNTHLLGEAVALFFIGTLCPELDQSKRWKQQGWEIILRESERQVQADGMHFEQSIYYHVYALDFFLHSAVLASLNDVPIPPTFDQTLEKMLEVLCVLGSAGPPPRLGDDDGGRLFDPRRNRAEHMLDPLATGAVLFGRGDFKHAAGGLREETLWLLGEAGIAEFDRLMAKKPAVESRALAASGLHLMGDAGSQDVMIIDAGAQGTSTAGHGHADALSITLNSEGRQLLIDPGACEYLAERSARRVFRGTSAHNTLTVDELDQAEPSGPFAWKHLPNVKTEQWINGKSFDFFAGRQDGYSRLPGKVLHRRSVFFLKTRFWVVRDMVEGIGNHTLDLYWHLSPELVPASANDSCFQNSEGRPWLYIVGTHDPKWTRELEWSPWSAAYGSSAMTRVVHFSALAELPEEFVTLLIPGHGAQVNVQDLVRIPDATLTGSAAGYRFGMLKDDHSVFFADGTDWRCGEWNTDARFVYCMQGENGARLICCDFSYVEFGGRKILSPTVIESWCEVIIDDGKMEVHSSGPQPKVDNLVVIRQAIESLSSPLEPAFAGGSSFKGIGS
ncbi:MAG: alginate lyase family protein [Acidobacteriales bacterium]|nr:alginate lyase family protein [Terriglobales bacterium]